MSSINLKDAFQNYKEEREFDRPTTMRLIEDVFKALLKKKYGTDENFDITVNAEKGDFVIYRKRMIVEDGVEFNEVTEVPYSEAQLIAPDYEVGEEVIEEVKLDDFGRRAALTAKQTIHGKINEIKKAALIKKYTDRIGDIISAEVYQVWKKEMLLLDEEGNELILPKEYQIPKDFYKKGDIVKASIERVENKNGLAQIIISRTSPAFLAKLIENEVPEIFDGIITIKKIVREPGERAKIAVETFDDRIDPVGACVGIRGSRIHGIVRELKNENLDIVNFTNNTQLFITRSLSPAKISSMEIDRENKHVKIYLKQDQVSLAIGKKGSNINLACELTGFKIDVIREGEQNEDQFDIELDEFNNEIDGWVIEEFKKIGCDTARSVLQLTIDELERRTDLERKTVEEVCKILTEEFEKGE
ncbi:MAG: transcription termination factor NusA [Alphaproteobacteria bacterium]|nr:transcription termination factor NusA [Alphaproteobacteria bacterium]